MTDHEARARQILETVAKTYPLDGVFDEDARYGWPERWAALVPAIAAALAEAHHCKDCCCARSWAALGITEYTGKSLPEHIEELRASLDRLNDDCLRAEQERDQLRAEVERLKAVMEAAEIRWENQMCNLKAQLRDKLAEAGFIRGLERAAEIARNGNITRWEIENAITAEIEKAGK
jgi:hypothetical protein